MKKYLLTTTLAAVLLTSATVHADGPVGGVADNVSTWFSDHFTPQESGTLFNADETSLDLGIDWYGKNRGNSGRFGFGFGAKHFFTTELGISVDSNIGFNGRSFFDFLHASFVYRYPMEDINLAPYAFVGAGAEFDPSNELSGNFGAGVEYRLNSYTGFYFDAGFNVVHRVSNYALLRGGIRIVF